jgi:hypothetical protein
LDGISYQLAVNCLHIIVHPVGDWSCDREDARFTVSPVPEGELAGEQSDCIVCCAN